MKLIKKLMVIFTLAPLTALAGGGSSVGNGGWAWVCRNPTTGRVWSAELFDLYIHRVGFPSGEKLTFHRSSEPAEVQYAKAVATFKKDVADDARRIYPKAFETLDRYSREFDLDLKFLKPGQTLPVAKDLTPSSLPPLLQLDCPWKKVSYEQLADYDYSHRVLLVDSDIYFGLDNLGQAAFKAHEVFYRLMDPYLRGQYCEISKEIKEDSKQWPDMDLKMFLYSSAWVQNMIAILFSEQHETIDTISLFRTTFEPSTNLQCELPTN